MRRQNVTRWGDGSRWPVIWLWLLVAELWAIIVLVVPSNQG